MKVKEIPLPKQGSIEYRHSERCCMKVKSFGTGYFSGRQGLCARVARFEMNGKKYCPQHAGYIALKHLSDNQITGS